MDRTDEPGFDREVLQAPGRTAALFWADWCPYARRFLPHFEAAELPGVRKVLVDVSDEGALWERCRIPVVPTIVVYADGSEVARVDGLRGRGIDPKRLDELRGAVC